MLTLAFRGIAALVAVISLFSAWLVSTPERVAQGGVPFSMVLEQLREADTLQFRVFQGGRSADVWLRRPGLARREELPQRYDIAAGSRFWKVDESTNTVVEGDSPWFLSPDKQIDLLSLLEVGVVDAGRLQTALPHKRIDYLGHDCDVYESIVETREGNLRIVAYSDAQSHQLRGIAAWPAAPKPAAAVPLAELQLVAVNPAVDDEKFVVSKSLAEDGRIGKIEAAQGVVLLRPLLAKRWTPISRGVILKTGDWIQTDLRGANAVRITLTSNVEVTLGPGALLETTSPAQARLHAGTAQVQLPKGAKSAFELLAPRTGSRKFTESGKTIVEVNRDEQLVDIKQTPVWLAGFEGTSSNESLGSLIVNIDGRQEPLTVGYHKVNVEIRDQIARTTIEESFVNHTDGRLEGIFHFPLPQDASISGFGMWIGNDLVEADVVEKQRAREIFETILREKRDPGLLEWTGGNIFKARVFPIEAHSEKRVKIVYTQVLPLRANRYRYSYGLRSELLQLKPLRELALTVTVSSALGLKNITCPSHGARIQKTANSGQVEFTAQEYTPNRDFEVVCEIDSRQSDVVVVPHRRGSDGYFLMQLTPPGSDGNWQRELLPEGAPLKLVLLCDTSASMDTEKRRQQREFVATVLASLGPNDRFQLAAADVGTVWPFSEPVAPSKENVFKVRTFLDERISLGWTDLNRAFEDILKKAPADAQVIYIGDGIVTAGDSDPHAFVSQLRRLVLGGDKTAQKRGFHAVTVGSSFESAVVKGIAGLAGGSVRRISGEQSPQTIALELLNELAQPGLSDLNVEFRGVKVAAVYPDKLPNVAAGMQQILVGRYLPEGKDQQGEVVVTGKRGGEAVRYVARINLKDAEEGNSFIPRLWAREHLEQLLQQGRSQAIRDQIIALSEEFHIMTPYTSLLVLESDNDRERFGVKRRYEMRDGEQFFADGRAKANFELLQQQMKRAGDWRIGMRRRVLRSLLGLGRNPGIFTQYAQQIAQTGLGRRSGFAKSLAPDDYETAAVRHKLNAGFNESMSGPFGQLGDADEDFEVGKKRSGARNESSKQDAPGTEWEFQSKESELRQRMDVDDKLALDIAMDSKDGNRKFKSDKRDFKVADEPFNAEPDADGVSLNAPAAMPPEETFAEEEAFGPSMRSFSERSAAAARKPMSLAAYTYRDRTNYYQPNYTNWLNELFPNFGTPESKTNPPPKNPEKWTAEALAISKSLDGLNKLNSIKGGLETRVINRGFDPRWNRRTYQNASITFYSPSSWLVRPDTPDGNTLVSYCDGRERGVYSLAFLLGRSRPTIPQDLPHLQIPLYGRTTTPWHETYREYTARVEPAGQNRATLIITSPNGTQVIKYLIDTQRNVQLKQEAIYDGKISGSTVFDDFIQINGVWWARRQSHRDAQDRVTSESLAEIREVTDKQHANRMAKELELKPQVQFLPMTLPKLSDARRKAADGSADFSDRIMLLISFAALQQWTDVLQQIDAIEKLAPQKPGIRWLRTLSLEMMRRNEEARNRYLAELDRLVKAKAPDELFLTEFILNHGSMVGSVAEHLDLLQKAKPVFDRQPAEIRADHRYESRLTTLLDGVGRTEEALTLRKKIATESPWDVYRQTDYAMRLRMAGRKKEAFEWLRKAIDRKEKWNASEEESLCFAYAENLRQEGDWAGLQKFTAEWIARNPEQPSPYSQHISALYFNDQLPAAYALADQWLQESRIDGKLRPDQKARLDATLNFALGSAHNLYFQRMDDRWLKPLADAVRFFVNHKHHYDVARRIMDDYRFGQTETGDRLRGEFLTRLQKEAKTLSVWQLSMLSAWALSQYARIELQEPIDGRKQLKSHELPLRIWEGVADEIHARWSRTQDKGDKFMLGERLFLIYLARFHDTRLLPFLRERVAGAPPEYKQEYLTRLFEDLLQRPWTPEIETECFTRLRELSIAEDETERLAMQLPALLRLVDSLVRRRIVHDEKQWRDKGGLDQLKRPEVTKKRAEFSTAARKAVSERLGREANQERNKTLADWLRIEQSWLDVGLQQRLVEIAEQCWKIVGEVPPKPLTPEDWDNLTDSQQRQRLFDSQLRHRAWTTLMYLAARRDATPQAVSRVLKYIDAGLDRPAEAARPWRLTKFRLLIALDRPDELERELQAWLRADAPTAPWRVLLANLIAERGKIAEAVTLFEVAEKDKLLSSRDVRQLADWYLVLNRRDDYERTRIAAFKLIPENHISNVLYQVRNRLRYNNKLTSELDENTLFMIRALFEKSSNPENYLSQLRDLYATCRDFRLLQMIPDAVLGRSPQQIYTYLEALRHQLLSELRNEATADPIIARIRELRRRDLTSTDLRALDLLEVVIERKSAELLNQPGPHIENCLAALKRAFARQWTDGEPLMMAFFLRQMEKLPHPSLVEEQLREMQALRQLTKPGSREHLQITTHDCVLRFRYYGRQEEALRDMSAEVALYEAANGGRWPAADNDNLDTYIGFYESLQRYLAGEAILFKYSAKPEHDDQKRWLDARLVRLYNAALAADGEVTLGTRSTLFNALVKRFQTDVEAAPDENVRHNLVSWFSDTLRIGFQRALPEAGHEIRKFAFLTLPVVLRKQQSQFRNTAQTPVYMFRDTVGYHDALQYIVERMEQYPRRFSNTWEDAWNTFGHQLAEFRHSASKASVIDLEPRILELTLQELRHEMQTGEGRSNGIYHRHNTYYWKEKEADFIRVANDVYSENSGSGRVAVRVANYLWNSSHQQDSAIAILLMAHRRGILEDQEINTLVSWLESRNRNAEAIPLLQALIRTYPDIINYYTRLMRAYHFTKQPQMLAELLQQAETHFHQGGRWTEGNMAELAHGCLNCQFTQKAIQNYEEALSLCKRDFPFDHRANYRLYERNYHLAMAYAAVGNTIKAVDAISESIVVAPEYYTANQGVNQLRDIMAQSKNLDTYVEHVDKESAKTGKDSPIIRKALGMVYTSRNDHARAIKQFELALALQPQDRESQESLVKAYDAVGRKADGTRQILRRLDFERHNLGLYQQLADRLRNNEAEAERAATSLIESAPNESENHAAFAQLRQQQNRWGEAIPHWRQVARLRRLEPTGLLELAKSQLHEKRWDDARSTLDELAKASWPERFGKVSDQVQELRRLLPK